MIRKLCVFACFPAGSKINTDSGLKNIEEIKAGNKVWSYNELTGETRFQEIVGTMVRESDHTVELYMEDEIIETTVEHPFLTEDIRADALVRDGEKCGDTAVKGSVILQTGYHGVCGGTDGNTMLPDWKEGDSLSASYGQHNLSDYYR